MGMAKKGNLSKGKDTGKPWKAFEKAVARIEQEIAQPGLVVTSPDFIPDLISGTKREVDASIRLEVGSAKILIVIECRNRSNKQDVLWIEQLIQKRTSIGASEIIAVSANGFTKEAINKAKQNNIKLRLLSNLQGSDIIEKYTWERDYVGYRTYTSHLDFLDRCGIEAANYLNEVARRHGNSVLSDGLIFHRTGTDELMSTSMIFKHFYDKAYEDRMFDDLKISVGGESPMLSLTMDIQDSGVYLKNDNGEVYRVKSMEVGFKMFRNVSVDSISELTKYSNEDESYMFYKEMKFDNTDPLVPYSKFTLVEKDNGKNVETKWEHH